MSLAKTISMTRRTGLALVLVTGLAMTACGGGGAGEEPGSGTGSPGTKLGTINRPSEAVPEDLVKKAQAEGEVRWYTASSVYELIAEAFEDAYGIKVVTNRQSSGPVTQQYMTEAQAGAIVADVIQAFNPLLYDEAARRGYFARIDATDIPNLAKLPKDLVKNPHYFPSNTWIWGLVWNTDLVPDGITDWEDLLDPELKGQIVMEDPRKGGVAAAFVDWMYNELGEDFLRKLGDQNVRWIDSQVAALDRLGAGEYAVVLPANKNHPDPLIEQGAPLKFGAPDVTSWFSHDLGISARASHPNAARLFANFLLSKEVQEGTSFAGPPIRPDIPGEGMAMLPTYTQLLPKDVAEGVQRTALFVELLKIS